MNLDRNGQTIGVQAEPLVPDQREAGEAPGAGIQELRHSDELLRLATRAGKVGLWEWDIARNVVVWTESLYPMHGISKEAFQHTREGFEGLVHPGDRDAVAEAIRRSLQDGAPFEFEFRILRPDGKTVWVYTDAEVLWEAGKPARVVGATVDISDRKRAEIALRESEQRFRLMSEHAPVMIWMSDADGRCLHLNRMLREFWGVAEADLSGFDWQTTMHPDDAPEIGSQISRALDHQREATIKGRYRRADGRFRLLSTYARPRFSDTGEFLGMIGVNIDETEREEAEAHRDLLVSELNHRVKNILAVVESVFHQTFKEADASPEARRDFGGRLRALATAHDLLIKSHWRDSSLGQLAWDVLAAQGTEGGRITVGGPDVVLEPRQAVSVAMVLHELCTNAIKYGALSSDEGRVTVSWTWQDEQEKRLKLVWREISGPPVSPPHRRGFGTRLVESALKQDSGKARIDFRQDGVVCTIDFLPCSWPPSSESRGRDADPASE